MNLFDVEDGKARKRVQKKLLELAEQLKAGLDVGDEIVKIQSAEFTKDTSRRAILADYAHAGEQPISTGGLLLSRGLIAYGKRVAYEMGKQAREADAIRLRDQVAEQERIDAGSKAVDTTGGTGKVVHRRGKAKGGKARA